MKNALLASLSMLIVGCTGLPEKVTPVDNFSLEKYLGTWYEIARLDHSFERGLSQVSAEYSLREDGGVAVKNRGYLASKERWKEATGKAYFVGEPDVGHLKVSFFGPFYGTYAIAELDEYQHALVSGPDLSYLWLLSRTRDPDPAVIQRLVDKASAIGFDTDALIFVDHQPVAATSPAN